MTKKQIYKLTKQIVKTWGMKMPEIKFLEYKYMKETLGIAFMGNYKHKNIYVKKDLIVFNTILFHYPFEKVIDVIYHELAHLITRKSDDDIEFEIFCKLNKISLSGTWEV